MGDQASYFSGFKGLKGKARIPNDDQGVFTCMSPYNSALPVVRQYPYLFYKCKLAQEMRHILFLILLSLSYYAPNFEKVGTYWFRLVRMYVRMYGASRYCLETSCMDSSLKNSRRVFFSELSPIVKLRPFEKQRDEIL